MASNVGSERVSLRRTKDRSWPVSEVPERPGPLSPDGKNFIGTLDKYQGGQCIACAYSGRPTLVGNDGPVAITFNSPTSATMTLPGGRVTQIQPQPF